MKMPENIKEDAEGQKRRCQKAEKKIPKNRKGDAKEQKKRCRRKERQMPKNMKRRCRKNDRKEDAEKLSPVAQHEWFVLLCATTEILTDAQ